MADYEIDVQDGHLHIRLAQVQDGWYARIDSDIEGRVFEGHVTELQDLLVSHSGVEAIIPSEDLGG